MLCYRWQDSVDYDWWMALTPQLTCKGTQKARAKRAHRNTLAKCSASLCGPHSHLEFQHLDSSVSGVQLCSQLLTANAYVAEVALPTFN